MKAVKLLVFVVVLLCLYAGPAWAQVTAVEKTGPDIVPVGEDFSYTITVSAGGSGATGVVVTDELPEGVEFIGSAPASIVCTEDGNVTDDQDTVTCSPFNIPANQQVSIVLNVTAPDEPGEISNIAMADPAVGLTVNSTPLVTQVVDLDFRKSGSPRTVEVGEEVTYTITVDNDGTDDIEDLEIDDLLQGADVDLQDVFTDRSEDDCFIVSNDEVECELGTLEGEGGDDVAEITIVVEALETGTIRNTATLLSEEGVEIAQQEVRTRVEDDDDDDDGNNDDGNNDDNNNDDNNNDDNNNDDNNNDDDDDDNNDDNDGDNDDNDNDDDNDVFGDDDDTGDGDGDGVVADANEDGASADTDGTSADAEGDPDEQAPVSRPRGDVVDEIDTGGTPLPPTGGRPVATLTPLAGIALAPLIWIALVATGLSARWMRRRRRQ